MTELNKKTTRVYPIRTEIINGLVTGHARKIAAIGHNEEFVIDEIEGNSDVTTMSGEVRFTKED